MAPLRAAKQLPTILWEIIWHKSLLFSWRFLFMLDMLETVMCVYFCLSDSYLNNPNPFFFVFFSGSSGSSFFLLFFSFFFLVFFFFTFFSSSRSCREELLAGVSLPESSSESSVVKNKDPDMSKHLMRSNHKESNNNPQNRLPFVSERRNSFFTLFLPVNQIQMGILAKCICIKF